MQLHLHTSIVVCLHANLQKIHIKNVHAQHENYYKMYACVYKHILHYAHTMVTSYYITGIFG